MGAVSGRQHGWNHLWVQLTRSTKDWKDKMAAHIRLITIGQLHWLFDPQFTLDSSQIKSNKRSVQLRMGTPVFFTKESSLFVQPGEGSLFCTNLTDITFVHFLVCAIAWSYAKGQSWGGDGGGCCWMSCLLLSISGLPSSKQFLMFLKLCLLI